MGLEVHNLQGRASQVSKVQRLAVAVLLASMLAGCSSSHGSDGSTAPGQVAVEGWVLDAALTPIPGASVVVQGAEANATTGDNGHYLLRAPSSMDLLVTVRQVGFVPQSRYVPAFSGSHQWINLTLERVISADPYTVVESWDGIMHCAVTAVAREDPSRPHEHQGVKCSDALPEETNQNVWHYSIPFNASGAIIELAWDPGTEFSQALVMKIEAETTGDILGFVEGTSILRLQVAAVNLARLLQSGDSTLRVTITPGAGTGSHEHGAVGVFVDQAFTIYATTFYNQPADPTYSIANR